MLLGFVDDNFNYRVFNLDTNRISISHNVFFQEDVFPFKRIVPPPVVVEEEERIEPHVTVQAPSTHDPHPTDDDELLGVPQSELRSSTETIPPGQLATPHSPPIEEFPPPPVSAPPETADIPRQSTRERVQPSRFKPGNYSITLSPRRLASLAQAQTLRHTFRQYSSAFIEPSDEFDTYPFANTTTARLLDEPRTYSEAM